MNCTICHKPVILNPSATERANKYGGSPQDYIKLFPTHSDCAIAKRNADVAETMRKLNNN